MIRQYYNHVGGIIASLNLNKILYIPSDVVIRIVLITDSKSL